VGVAVFGRALDDEALVAVGGVEAEPAGVAGVADDARASEPGRRLVAVGVVDEDGVVGFHDDDHVAAEVAFRLAAHFVAHGTLACEHADGVLHGPGWSRSRT